MKRIDCVLLLGMMVVTIAVVGCRGGRQVGGNLPPSHPRIIFDTDMYNDFDDVGALAMLHALADAGECEIVAVGCNTHGKGNRSVAVCEIINAYYGRSDIEVGGCRAGGKCGAGAKGYGLMEKYESYVDHLEANSARRAVDIYREALEECPDKSVTICSVGFLNNIALLLKTDRELIERKVKLWVCMACRFPYGRECNSRWDPISSNYAFANWPKSIPIVWTDYNYGRYCYAGRAVAELPDDSNPIRDAFAHQMLPCEKVTADSVDQEAGHPAWDETAVLIAVRGWERYFYFESGSYRMVNFAGDNEWCEDDGSCNGRVTERVSRAEVGRVIDEIMCRRPVHPWGD